MVKIIDTSCLGKLLGKNDEKNKRTTTLRAAVARLNKAMASPELRLHLCAWHARHLLARRKQANAFRDRNAGAAQRELGVSAADTCRAQAAHA